MKGLVTKSTGLWYEIESENERFVARLRGKFKLENKKLTNPIAVGDEVEFERNDQMENEWVITEIKPRKNYIIRQSPRKKGHDHLLASNIDQGVLVVTLRMPRTSVGFIDRFLITLEAYRIPGVILFNKKDLFKKKDQELFEELKSIYQKVGYQVILCSFLEDVDSLKEIFSGKRSLISGHSGSGKSTLVNKLAPDAKQEVKDVSSFANKGVHTTTFAELFKLDDKSSLIDTPGIKELGLSEVQPEELSHYFPEMRQFLGQCKYNNCLHYEEPGCAVKNMVGTEISERRFENYLGILFQNEDRR
ncbi:MAG: ribosome small subunit-dependent GTPase A [Cyclobacteriaceae bacterium]